MQQEEISEYYFVYCPHDIIFRTNHMIRQIVKNRLHPGLTAAPMDPLLVCDDFDSAFWDTSLLVNAYNVPSQQNAMTTCLQAVFRLSPAH